MADRAIECAGLSYAYEDGTPALRDISFAIEQGESVALVGHNGSGKSTLLMHFVGIIGPDPRITVAGIPVAMERLAEVRGKIGYVFQDARDQLFMSTVLEDVAFGPANMGLDHVAVHEAVDRALDLVGLAGFKNRVSYHLSGGEMRKAAIASVLAMSPEIVVMDEPSAGLDPRATRDLAALIRRLDGTHIIASHDLPFVRACTDRTIILRNGMIVADGPTGELLDDPERLKAFGL